MRYIPDRRGSMFDSMMESVFGSPFSPTPAGALMRTDIYEKDGKYILSVDMPGYKKEDIKIALYNGELTISASRNESQEEKDEKGNLIRQERYSGSCSRSFYVGDTIRQEDIQASFKDGILTLELPTAEKKEAEEKKYIDIF